MSKLLEQINTKNIEMPIGELCSTIFSGGTPSTTNPNFWNGAIPWLSSGETRQDFINETEKKITKDGVENSSTRLALKNDVVIATAGQGLTRGQTSFLNIDTYINQSLISLRANSSKLESQYLYYYLKSKYKKLRSLSDDTSSRGSITIPILSRIKINLPNLPTQKKIAEILSAYDAKIENNNKIIKNLEATAQTIFNEWFVKFRLPAEVLTKAGFPDGKIKMVESEMGEIPEGWEINSLDDICDISIGRTPPRQEQEWFSRNPKDVKWVSIKDLGVGGIFISKTDEYLTKEAVERFNIPVIPKGTLVVSFKLTMGKVAITTEDMLSNEAIAHLKIREKTAMFVEYLYLIMKSYNYDSLGSTSSIATAVNSKTIKSIKIIVPAKVILHKFGEKIKPLFEMMNVVQKENKTLKESRDQLLAKLI